MSIWPFRRTDYHAGSVTYSREALLGRLLGQVRVAVVGMPNSTIRPLVSGGSMLFLFRDKEFLSMRHDLAEKFCFNARSGYPDYEAEVCDCDDLEGLFRADRIRYRWKANLRIPEAMGGVDYIRKDGICHRAAWALTDKGLYIIQPQSGAWARAEDEVREAVYFDA